MSGNAIQRPEFSDGQILDASDLNLSVDHSRDEDARHARYSHSWGISFGYDLKINGSPTPSRVSKIRSARMSRPSSRRWRPRRARSSTTG
jgi:hypothetical protein